VTVAGRLKLQPDLVPDHFIAEYEPLSEGGTSHAVEMTTARAGAGTPPPSESDPISVWADQIVTRMNAIIERWKA
jgi:hypothetical protein